MKGPLATPEELAAEYAAARRRTTALLSDVSEEQAATVVPACPDWTVKDLAAHLSGVCADLVAGRRPEGDVQDWVDAHVVGRRDVPVAQLVSEWDEAGPAFEDLIRKHPGGFGGLLYDVVSHEHDLRGALGRPGDRDSAGVRWSVAIIARMIEADLAKHGLGGTVRVGAEGDEWVASSGDGPEVSVELPTRFELFRALGSRRSRAQLAQMPWRGDLDRLLPAIAHLPLPERDIVE